MSDDAFRTQIELRRLLAESDKFVAEQRKLMAEAAKFDRDRWTPLVLAVAAAFGAFAGALSILAKVMGWG
jgi:hypothetical protein